MEFGTREMPPRKGSDSKPLGRHDANGPQSGEVLQGRYMILGSLGVGGFSSVYRARDLRFPSVTRLCAVKEMVISTVDPEMRELTIKSFEREAGMLATLNHPAIPDIYDYFTDGNRSYLVLEFVPGQNLQQWLDETDEYLDEQKALDWALQVCDALAYLHSQKPQPVIFRDLKPSNIMLDPYNHIRLIDFGIAKLFEANEDKGTMIGTAGYTPPEQYRGEASPAVDVYGLGATLHHLLTRQDPRQETPFTFSERPIRAANPAISRTFEAIIMRCLAYDPKERFPDAMALRESLLELSKSDTDDADLDQRLGLKENALAFDREDTGAPTASLRAGLSRVKPLWVFRCEDEIRSRPAVGKGIVFVAAYDNNLYALTADKGDFLWKFPTGGGIGGSPVVSEDAVLIGSSDHSLYSLQLRKGRLNWQFRAEGPIYSSPAVRFDHAFFGADDGYVYVVNAMRGQLHWKTNVYSPVRSTPWVSDELVYFGTEGGQVLGLELGAGKPKWQTKAQRAVTSSPKVADDILYVGSVDGTVYAIDASSGWPIWRYQTDGPILATPTLYQGVLFIGSSDGHLYAIDMASGRPVWSYHTNGQIVSAPAVWGNTVYFGSTDGGLYGVSLRRGALQWRFDTSSPIIGSPTIVNGVIYFGAADHTLYALPT
ncbi:MAG TPA: serine/threonine-protein kinase [Promineifilum sp.]|nr:serine/threonine-protein kinase [Promineifilum sp.]